MTYSLDCRTGVDCVYIPSAKLILLASLHPFIIFMYSTYTTSIQIFIPLALLHQLPAVGALSAAVVFEPYGERLLPCTPGNLYLNSYLTSCLPESITCSLYILTICVSPLEPRFRSVGLVFHFLHCFFPNVWNSAWHTLALQGIFTEF